MIATDPLWKKIKQDPPEEKPLEAPLETQPKIESAEMNQHEDQTPQIVNPEQTTKDDQPIPANQPQNPPNKQEGEEFQSLDQDRREPEPEIESKNQMEVVSDVQITANEQKTLDEAKPQQEAFIEATLPKESQEGEIEPVKEQEFDEKTFKSEIETEGAKTKIDEPNHDPEEFSIKTDTKDEKVGANPPESSFEVRSELPEVIQEHKIEEKASETEMDGAPEPSNPIEEEILAPTEDDPEIENKNPLQFSRTLALPTEQMETDQNPVESEVDVGTPRQEDTEMEAEILPEEGNPITQDQPMSRAEDVQKVGILVFCFVFLCSFLDLMNHLKVRGRSRDWRALSRSLTPRGDFGEV